MNEKEYNKLLFQSICRNIIIIIKRKIKRLKNGR